MPPRVPKSRYASPPDSGYSRDNISGYHYKVTALDYAENESAPAVPGSVTAVDDPTTP